jgi:hypothetical protein
MTRSLKLIGKKFGRLTVMEQSQSKIYDNGKKRVVFSTWKCKCDCGNETTVLGINLTSEKTITCGHHHTENLNKYRYVMRNRHVNKYKKMIGKKMNKLKLISVIESDVGRIMGDFECDCGKHIVYSIRYVLRGNKKSCSTTPHICKG